MLGYGGGTAAGLMRLFYGDIPITAVDMHDCIEFNYYGVELIQADALEYMRSTEKQFDVISVDLFREGSYYAEPFVYEKEFATLLSQKCNYGIVHTVVDDDMSAYADFYRVRTLSLNTDSKYCPEFHYFMFNDQIPLPVR
jgi:spermidine synthase